MDDNNNIEISKYLAQLLRHNPGLIGLSMDEHGWVSVDKLIEGIGLTRKINMSMLERIVEDDDKQRYSFNKDKTLIRANQGHSVLVDVGLKIEQPPQILYHGTGEKYVASIDVQGLISKSRLYVHLSMDKDTALKVGQRHGMPVIYIVESGKMFYDGYKFYQSVNGVWLTKAVPLNYLRKQVI